MRTAYRVFLGVGLAALVFLASCSQPGASSTPPSNAQAQTMTTNVMTALSAAMTASGASYKSLNSGKGLASQTTISYSGAGYTVTGYYNSSGSGVSANITITFTSFSSNGITFSSGSANLVLTIDSAGNETLVYTGNFNITYQGTPYTFGWNLTYSYVVSPYSITYTGYFTIDGQQYTYTG